MCGGRKTQKFGARFAQRGSEAEGKGKGSVNQVKGAVLVVKREEEEKRFFLGVQGGARRTSRSTVSWVISACQKGGRSGGATRNKES